MYLQVPRWVPFSKVQTMEYMQTPDLPSTEHGLPGSSVSILDNMAPICPSCSTMRTVGPRTGSIVGYGLRRSLVTWGVEPANWSQHLKGPIKTVAFVLFCSSSTGPEEGMHFQLGDGNEKIYRVRSHECNWWESAQPLYIPGLDISTPCPHTILWGNTLQHANWYSEDFTSVPQQMGKDRWGILKYSGILFIALILKSLHLGR